MYYFCVKIHSTIARRLNALFDIPGKFLTHLSTKFLIFNNVKAIVKNGKKYVRLKKNTTACYERKFYLSQTAKMENIKNSVIKKSIVIEKTIVHTPGKNGSLDTLMNWADVSNLHSVMLIFSAVHSRVHLFHYNCVLCSFLLTGPATVTACV